MDECYIRGSTIKYCRIPDEVCAHIYTHALLLAPHLCCRYGGRVTRQPYNTPHRSLTKSQRKTRTPSVRHLHALSVCNWLTNLATPTITTITRSGTSGPWSWSWARAWPWARAWSWTRQGQGQGRWPRAQQQWRSLRWRCWTWWLPQRASWPQVLNAHHFSIHGQCG